MRILARSINYAIVVAAMACSTPGWADLRPAQPCPAAAAPGPMREMRQQRFARLVCMRSSAIGTAFGVLFEGRDIDIRIKFPSAGDPQYPPTSMSAYDPADHTIYFRHAVLANPIDAWSQWALAYWPYYRDDAARQEYPVVGMIDEALWNAHLHQAAHERGLSWPHPDCRALDIARRFGCEMLLTAITELSQSQTLPMFNANRIDQLWPEDLRDFERRAWTHGGREYREVRRLGGLLLIEPLVREFGAPRVFAYVARTPFRIENANVRLSALHYQDQARNALAW